MEENKSKDQTLTTLDTVDGNIIQTCVKYDDPLLDEDLRVEEIQICTDEIWNSENGNEDSFSDVVPDDDSK